jgi:hypothetical protein
MEQSKIKLLKSINAAFIIGICVILAFGLLMGFILLGANPDKTMEDWVVVSLAIFVLTVIPAIGIHIFRTKYWIKKYPELQRKNNM